MSFEVRQGDCVELMAAMPAGSVDAVVCDPPYALGFMSKQWDQFRGSGSEWSTKHNTGPDWKGRERERPSRLTMRSYHYVCQTCGKQQHQHDDEACPDPSYERVMHEPTQLRAFQAWCEAWATEALRVLKPGGHLLAFGGTRTYHRLVCAVEDAGFEIRDTICWLYGSGFPKSLNVGNGFGTALKPAHEPVVVARKPLSGTVAATVLEHGTGALNIDGTRVGTGDDIHGIGYSRGRTPRAMAPGGAERTADPGDYDTPTGRWPANVVLDEEAAGLLDEQTGELTSGNGQRRPTEHHTGFSEGRLYGASEYERPGDSGGASRFFPTFPTDTLCVQCGLPLAEVAGNPSLQSERASGTVPADAQASLSLEPEGNEASSSSPATSAEPPSRTTPATEPESTSTARPSAPPTSTERSAPDASDAEYLCKRCTTAIARSGAATSPSHEAQPLDPSEAGPRSGEQLGGPTRTPSPASTVASQGSTDTTSSTSIPPSSSGSAPDATLGDIPIDAMGDEAGPTRFRYQSKASRGERNAGLEGFEETEKRHAYGDGLNSATKLDPEMHTAEGVAARPPTRNGHPTVKPISLMRWLVRLVTPPGGTVLDCFCGSGTTGIAAVLEGFNFIGLEQDAEYVKIARARIAWWHKHRGDGEAAEILAAGELRDSVEATGQLGMFD